MEESEEIEVAPREVTPPTLQQPTAKEKKYDRQLRLWAAAGQRALEEAHVLLIVGEEDHGSNSSVAGAETLKNLVLPSIGNFTIADSAKVKEADLGINFFLEADSLGKSRAAEMTRLLQELNPDVSGHSITEKLMQWLPLEGSLIPYNLIIICAPLETEALLRVSKYAQNVSIPVVYIHSVGFYSSFSIQIPPEFPIVDTHPDPESTQDLRLLAPWPELSEAADAIKDLKTFSDHDHGHIPYILLLLHYLDEWRDSHEFKFPLTFKEKTEFREFVRSNARTSNPEGGEENYDEACSAVLKCITEPPVGSGCKEMFAMDSCNNLSVDSANFWIVANAIQVFYKDQGFLPLPGSLPDMKATSEAYVRLQNIYKSKARADVAEVTSTVRTIEKSLSRVTPIPEAEIEQFCKNASHVRVLTNPNNLALPALRLATLDPNIIKELQSQLEMDWEDTVPIFIALNSNTIPSKTFSSLTSDEEKLETLHKTHAEVDRAKGGELHNISSLTGGMVAQEVIKLLTKQYVPVEGTCIFDGIRSKSGVFKL